MPIPPTNTTPATAFDLTGLLPLNDTIDLTSLPNPQKVWFKFTLNGEFALSAWIQRDATAPNYNYTGDIKFYLELPTDPNVGILQHGGHGEAVEFFIEELVGVPKVGTVYISMQNGYLPPNGVVSNILTIKFVKIPNIAVPANSILISNDGGGYPLTLVHLDGTPAQLRSFKPYGESGAILNNGISLWAEGYPDHSKLFLYDANLVLITELSWSVRNRLRSAISSNYIDTFYLECNSKIITVSSTGEISSTVWTVPTANTIYWIAPAIVDTDIIYVKDVEGIHKFHKSTQLLDSPIIPYELYDITGDKTYYFQSGYYGDEFIILENDNIVTMYSPTSINPDKRCKVTYHTSTGLLIRELFTDSEDINRIHISAPSSTKAIRTTVWSWSYTESFKSQFIQWDLINGLRITEFSLETTSTGSSFSVEEVPDEMFGVPESCPFIITTTPIPAYGEEFTEPEPIPIDIGGIYFINPVKPTRHDSYYNAVEKKIPDPTIKTALLGE